MAKKPSGNPPKTPPRAPKIVTGVPGRGLRRVQSSVQPATTGYAKPIKPPKN